VCLSREQIPQTQDALTPCASDLFKKFGHQSAGQEYRNQADTLRRAVYEKCYDAKTQLIADTPAKREFSQHANVMAILTDAIPVGQQRALMERILTDQR
jgi:alpha-L-rhamnosidase